MVLRKRIAGDRTWGYWEMGDSVGTPWVMSSDERGSESAAISGIGRLQLGGPHGVGARGRILPNMMTAIAVQHDARAEQRGQQKIEGETHVRGLADSLEWPALSRHHPRDSNESWSAGMILL